MRTLLATSMFGLVALLGGACGGGDDRPSMAAPEAALPVDTALNQKPNIERVRLHPESPVPGDRIEASVEASDPEGEPVEIVYQWRVNGRQVEGSEPSFRVEDLTKGSAIEVTVVARDGKDQSAPVRKMVRIGNTAPVMQGVVIEPLGEVTANQDVSANPKAVDRDGDEISFSYEWRVNGALFGEDSSVLSAEHFERGDEIELSVIASDGEGSSSRLRSDALRVVNAPPKIASVPGAFDEEGIFRYALKVEDADDDRMFRYQLEEAPEGMKIDVVRGLLSWEPREDQIGDHPVVVTVDDRSGGVATQRFEVQVGIAPSTPAAPAR